MKLYKLATQNFKGVYKPNVIELGHSVTILHGPNGFGKTTTFDAIELCITGKIYRVDKNKIVTDDRSDYTDAFYRNRPGEDVIIKLLVERADGEKKVIVKRLPADSPGIIKTLDTRGVNFKVTAWELLETYLIEAGKFSEELNFSIEQVVTQTDIEEWLFNGQAQSSENIYKLFGYLQQEENTFYLKQSEKDRKGDLDHLFKTDKEASELESINSYLSALRGLRITLHDNVIKIDSIEQRPRESVKYSRLTSKTLNAFDKEEPFEKNDIESLDEAYAFLRGTLSNIEQFISKFDPDEYNKQQLKNRFVKVTANVNLLNYLILRNYLGDDTYSELSKKQRLLSISGNDNFLKYFILQKFFDEATYSQLKDTSKKYTQYYKLLNNPEISATVESKLDYIKTWEDGVSDKDLEATKTYAKSLTNLTQSLDISSQALTELQEFIATLTDAYNKAHKAAKEMPDSECPYCGNDWGTHEKLLQGVEAKATTLSALLKGQSTQINNLKKEIKSSFLDNFESVATDFMEHNGGGYRFFLVLQKIRQELAEVDYAKDAGTLTELLPEAESYIWEKVETSTLLQSQLEALSDLIKTKLYVDEGVLTSINKLRGYSFTKGLDELKELKIDIGNVAWKDKLRSKSELDKELQTLIESIRLKGDQIEIDASKLGGDFAYLYKQIFLEDPAAFLIAKQGIGSKLEYVSWKYHQKKYSSFEVLSKREAQLTKLIDKVEGLKTAYEGILKDYKGTMIKKIKLPFYIYSSKVIQNYQQGMGVFIGFNEGSGAIRFLTGSQSNHDIVHHLSSGQLSVVSIAFSLAINKVYSSSSLNFIAIDDPVQELDALNIYSLIEVLRRDFVPKYQLLVSTHDEPAALYMHYKFSKTVPDGVSSINIQEHFFPRG